MAILANTVVALPHGLYYYLLLLASSMRNDEGPQRFTQAPEILPTIITQDPIQNRD